MYVIVKKVMLFPVLLCIDIFFLYYYYYHDDVTSYPVLSCPPYYYRCYCYCYCYTKFVGLVCFIRLLLCTPLFSFPVHSLFSYTRLSFLSFASGTHSSLKYCSEAPTGVIPIIITPAEVVVGVVLGGEHVRGRVGQPEVPISSPPYSQ